MTATTGALHWPDRPSWMCGCCGQPWPCSPARVSLGEEYATDRVALSIYMATQLADATAEAKHAPPAELHDRFVAWTR